MTDVSELEKELQRLRAENAELKAEVASLRKRRPSGSRDERGLVLVTDDTCATDDYTQAALSIIGKDEVSTFLRSADSIFPNSGWRIG